MARAAHRLMCHPRQVKPEVRWARLSRKSAWPSPIGLTLDQKLYPIPTLMDRGMI